MSEPNQELNPESITATRLLELLARNYGLTGTLKPCRRGFFGKTWQFEPAALPGLTRQPQPGQPQRLFIKMVAAPEYSAIYRRSFAAVKLLTEHGIDFIGQVIPAANGDLYSSLDQAVVGVFTWLEGKNLENDDTKATEYQLLARVYQTAAPYHDRLIALGTRVEEFRGDSAVWCYKQLQQCPDLSVIKTLQPYWQLMQRRACALEFFAGQCRQRQDVRGFYLTHGDAGGNLMTDGQHFVLADWDDVLIAPPERDAWVMGYNKRFRELFTRTMQHHGLGCSLKPERLAYYSNYMFFFWLGWMIKCSTADTIADFFTTWTEKRIDYGTILWQHEHPNQSIPC